MTQAAAFAEANLPLFMACASAACAPDTPGDEAPDAPLPAEGRLPSYIRGHRKRLRDRFATGGPAAMPDYELLELILFRAQPRQDVKPLARLLLDTFGDFNRVISAPPARLAAVPGGGDAAALPNRLAFLRAQCIKKMQNGQLQKYLAQHV